MGELVMAKSKNQHIYNADQSVLIRLAEEFKSIGRYVRLEEGHLTVLALPPKKVVKKVDNPRRKSRRTSNRAQD